MSIVNWVSNAIAFLALGVAGLALYLQRKDKRPDLAISVQGDREVAQMVDDGGGGVMAGPKELAQIFEIRNVGMRRVRINAVQTRWVIGRPTTVTPGWNSLPVLDPDNKCEYAVLISNIITGTPSGLRRVLPFYRVEFFDAVGRRWSAGYRRVRVAK